MKTLWKVFAWLAAICGLVTYLVGWLALIQKSAIWIPTEFWFYDAIAAGVFAVFFLLYAVHGE